jgi:hypothetical protein
MQKKTAIRHISLPRFISPQVPILCAEPSSGPGWIHEIKHDVRLRH